MGQRYDKISTIASTRDEWICIFTYPIKKVRYSSYILIQIPKQYRKFSSKRDYYNI